MSNFLGLLLLLSIILPAARAQADNQLVTHLSLFYFNEGSQRSVEAGNNDYVLKSQDTYTFTSLGLCYTMDALCVGLKYLQNDIDTKTSNSVSGNSTKVLTRFKGPGLSLGYTNESLFVQAVWLLNATKEIDSKDVSVYGSNTTTAVTYPAKSAYLIDIGYGFKVASVRIGPLLSMYQFDYEKITFDGSTIELPAKEKDNFLVPQVAIWVDL